MLLRCFATFLLLIGTSAAYAELFKCTDPNGNVSFSDKPCAGDATGGDIEGDLPHINSSTPSYGVKQIQRRAKTAEQAPVQAPTETKTSREDRAQQKRNKKLICDSLKEDYRKLSHRPTCSRSKFAKHDNCVMVREGENGEQYGKIKQEKYRKNLKKRIDRECS